MKQSFYRKLRAQAYDIGTDVSEVAGYYLEMWQQLGKPTPVLEPMCGTALNSKTRQWECEQCVRMLA